MRHSKKGILKNNSGFSFMELMVVMAIIAILAAIATTSVLASRQQVSNATALSDAQLLGKAVLSAFLDGYDVNLFHLEGSGDEIGKLDTAGNNRTPIFTLSTGVKAQIVGSSDFPAGSGWGKCVAQVWHPQGTKSYWLIIDEAAQHTDFPSS